MTITPVREPLATPLTLPRECTFHEQDWQILARSWYPVSRFSDVGDGPEHVRLLDAPLVVYRSGDEIVVADDICPHRGVPLSAGTGDGTGITCPYHGLRFGAAGQCVKIPAHPTDKIPARMHLKPYPVVQRYGLVWTSLDRDADPDALPVLRYWEQPGFQNINLAPFDVKAFAGRQVEGFLDVAHFGFVHEATFGDPENAEVPPYSPQKTDYGFEVDYWSTVGNYPKGGVTEHPGFEWLRHFELFTPFTATITVHFPDDGILNIMNAACPVSAKQTRMFAPLSRNFDTDRPEQEVHDFNLRVFEEDRAVVEIQKPENLPLDPRLEVHIPADRSSIAYRRALRDLGLSEFFTA
ncbi:MAG: aromatic ring-hydroxylating dioxygenase subunit alpha [Gordonia sp. (in: high G+C Gram-positive bacteria)]|uniref:Rieske 2Fe-2S domain-containing protein n=1 Tax=Gordonia sp. (in: high G+C Gram-positive bacteria) TaxID=84139 RepID=UPI0039E4C853